MARKSTRAGCSLLTDAKAAVADLKQQVDQPRLALVLVFCSVGYPLETLVEELDRQFPGVTLAGCTTAGEIGPAGYRQHSLSAISFAAPDFSVSLEPFERLGELSVGDWRARTARTLSRHNGRFELTDDGHTFGLLLVDGLSVREEPLVRTIASALPGIPLFGGSAGDDLRLERTFVLCRGRLLSDSALLLLITTPLPFRIFKTQHFVASEQRMVVTAADPARRTVTEINGLPAGPEYARLLGLDRAQPLTPMVFAAHPVVVKMGESEYVRSIQKMNPDGSLTFFCAIDVGIVLRAVTGVDLIENLAQQLDSLKAQLGPPQALITCDCILRRLELEQQALLEPVSALLAENGAVGFSTYGEQFNGVHVNQTCTGIAIGYPSD